MHQRAPLLSLGKPARWFLEWPRPWVSGRYSPCGLWLPLNSRSCLPGFLLFPPCWRLWVFGLESLCKTNTARPWRAPFQCCRPVCNSTGAVRWVQKAFFFSPSVSPMSHTLHFTKPTLFHCDYLPVFSFICKKTPQKTTPPHIELKHSPVKEINNNIFMFGSDSFPLHLHLIVFTQVRRSWKRSAIVSNQAQDALVAPTWQLFTNYEETQRVSYDNLEALTCGFSRREWVKGPRFTSILEYGFHWSSFPQWYIQKKLYLALCLQSAANILAS